MIGAFLTCHSPSLAMNFPAKPLSSPPSPTCSSRPSQIWKIWEKHITAILRSPTFGFKSTTYDKSIYSATFEGTRILLLRQVDDFVVACPNEDLAKRLYDQIGKALQLPSEDTPPFKYLSLIKDFNGLDVAQYSDAIKLSCEKYIDRVLTTHGWSKPPPPVPTKPSTPLPVDAVTSLYTHQGPPENTAEHAALVL